MVVPKNFPQSPGLRKIVEKGENAEVRGAAMLAIKKNWRSIVYDVCSGLAAHDIAVKYQAFSERSFWNFLKKLGLDFSDIKEACQKEEEFKRMTRLEKLRKKQERLKLLPTTFEEFVKLETMEKLAQQLRVKGDTEAQIKRNLKTIFELCMFKGKRPEDITVDDIIEFVDYKRMEWQEKGKDLRVAHVAAQFSSLYISPLRVFAQFIGLPIPPVLSTTEYHSPYRKVRLTTEQRYRILKWLKENEHRYKNHVDYDTMRAVVIFLYETGSRAQALLTTEIVETEEYGVRVYYAHTREKGKKHSIEWWKPLNPKWVQYILGRIPLKNGSALDKVRRVLKMAYEEVLPDGLTKRYALEHPIHVWRHTAANDLLEATNWNLMIVAKRLGWKNPSMIVNVYGDMDKAALLKISGYETGFKPTRFEFLHGEWEERARAEGLI